jgi:tRNA (cytidine/uridine-2'-O-)-methyltransferase
MRLALFQPDIPQNLGGAIRLSACMGAALEIIEPCGFPLTDRSLKRAALDYGGHAEVIRHRSWTEFLGHGARQRGLLLLFTTHGARPFIDFAYRPQDTLLFGRESAGVPDEVHAAADARLLIPMMPGMRSLNVVAAAAMALGEALRQTNGFPSPAQAM